MEAARVLQTFPRSRWFIQICTGRFVLVADQPPPPKKNNPKNTHSKMVIVVSMIVCPNLQNFHPQQQNISMNMLVCTNERHVNQEWMYIL